MKIHFYVKTTFHEGYVYINNFISNLLLDKLSKYFFFTYIVPRIEKTIFIMKSQICISIILCILIHSKNLPIFISTIGTECPKYKRIIKTATTVCYWSGIQKNFKLNHTLHFEHNVVKYLYVHIHI